MSDDENRTKKRKRVTIGVDDVYNVFQRYSESNVITLYQEIAKFCGEKIDWKELVKSTSTGIKNAREYQMLWRHLAYKHPLEEEIEDGAELLDDESDLETELEAIPLGSPKTLAEAQACVKVLLASGPQSTSNFPDNLAANASLGTNELCTGSSPKRQFSAPEYSNYIAAIGGNPLSKKKRQMWSKEDDMILFDGVNKCGVGNWATISREIFNGKRTAAQVGSRWKQKMEKKYPNSTRPNVNGRQLSNEQATIATRNAISMALKMPASFKASTVAGTASVNQFTQAASSAVLTKPTIPVDSSVGSDSVLLATAVAAGARIATPETAESLLKVAHANNAVHIMHGGGSKKKTGSFSTLPTSNLVATHQGSHKTLKFISYVAQCP